MYDTPDQLQNICIDFVSEFKNSVFSPIRDVNGNIVRYEFKDRSLHLPACLSEALLEALDCKKALTERELSLFASPRTPLHRVHIGDASLLPPKALRAALQTHKLMEITARGLSNASVLDLLGSLSEWTGKNLRHLDVSGGRFGGSVRVVFALSQLKSLKSLDLSFTELTSQGLELVSLEGLEELRVAGTAVADVRAVVAGRSQLRSLDLADLRLTSCGWGALQGLLRLRHLDLSTVEDCGEEGELLGVLEELPELVSLDLSGRRGLNAQQIRSFLSSRRKPMEFLGLMENEACQDSTFCCESDPFFDPNLIVTGFGCERQVLASLQRYVRRKSFLHKALCYLYNDIQNLTRPRPDIIELVLRGVAQFPTALGVQVAGTACLYILRSSCPCTLLRPLANATLDAMQRFPTHLRLQKNALLTLCSERMLQDAYVMDRYRCAELALNSLLNFEEPALNRMAVAICSVLASRISTVETSNLGAKTDYMVRLLDIVRSKTEVGENDVMMKFTLSALWNLTDESPRTCVVFLDQGGLQLFQDVLNKFSGESSVETKVLGLMNNLAEVSLLREDLMKMDLIDTLRRLLQSERVDVSYFAAGVVAHLASDGEESWGRCDWAGTLQELGLAVSGWDLPPTEMVAYRSLKPFYPLLRYSQAFQVQLWAAWAIHHVCCKNPERYCQLLVEEGGMEVVRELLPSLHTDVAVLCHDILRLCAQSPQPVASNTRR